MCVFVHLPVIMTLFPFPILQDELEVAMVLDGTGWMALGFRDPSMPQSHPHTATS